HIASDRWSMGILVKEIAELYECFLSGTPSRIEELSVQYVDFAAWQRQWLQGEALEARLSYWKKHLTGAPPVLELPKDRPRPAIQIGRGANLFFSLPRNLSETLKALSRRVGATLFMTLLAAFKSLLHRYTDQHHIVIGTTVANRTLGEVEGLIGF